MQEIVPRIKDHGQCEIKVHRESLVEKGLVVKVSLFLVDKLYVYYQGRKGEIKWGTPEGLRCLSD